MWKYSHISKKGCCKLWTDKKKKKKTTKQTNKKTQPSFFPLPDVEFQYGGKKKFQVQAVFCKMLNTYKVNDFSSMYD